MIKKSWIMKFNHQFLNFVLIAVLFTVFLTDELQVNDFKASIKTYSSSLHGSSALTDLSFFTWGGIGVERSGGIALDSLNNSYIVGSTKSYGAGEDDFCLIKFNSSGVEWNRTYGGINRDHGRAIALDSHDNIYLTGYTKSFGAGDFDIWLLKLNTTGDVEWSHTWGGIEEDIAWGIALDSNANAYVVGKTSSFGEGSSDMCVIKFNSSGMVWNYTCGGIEREDGYSLTLDSLGNVYAVGRTESYGAGESDLYLVKINSTGMVWNRTWGCVYRDIGTDIELTPAGNLYVSGYFQLPPECLVSPGYGIEYDIGVVKFNSDGIYQWNSTWQGGYYDYCFGMALDSHDNIFVAGYTNSDGYSDYDICLVRFNSSGAADWSCTWGRSENEYSEGIVLGPNGTVLVCGYTYSYGHGGSDICLVEFIPGHCPVSVPPNIDGIIPGYDIVLLISIAIVISVFLIKKKKIVIISHDPRYGNFVRDS